MTIITTLLLATILSASQAFTLITFDVDGTLVKGSGKDADASAHSRAFSHAVGSVLGDGNPVQPVAEALPRELYHGSTDGLISLRLSRATLGIEPAEAAPQLDAIMETMYDYISKLTDEEVAQGITPLPNVIETLERLSTMKDRVMCGLVTGNVEGIARRKMRAVGMLQTGALAKPSPEQLKRKWAGSDDIGFLGGFGSDFCSGDIDDPTRNYLDRSQQIEIAANRCRMMLGDRLKRVVHVGDAPADVLAAKAYAERVDGICVGMVATATGSYGAEELRQLAGESVPGRWEPVILEDGIADPGFLAACGIQEE